MPQSVNITAPIDSFEASIKHLRIPKARQKELLAVLDRAWARHCKPDAHSGFRVSGRRLAESEDWLQKETAEAIKHAERELEMTRQAETGKQRKSASAA